MNQQQGRTPGEYPFYPQKPEHTEHIVDPLPVSFMGFIDAETGEKKYVIDYGGTYEKRWKDASM